MGNFDVSIVLKTTDCGKRVLSYAEDLRRYLGAEWLRVYVRDDLLGSDLAPLPPDEHAHSVAQWIARECKIGADVRLFSGAPVDIQFPDNALVVDNQLGALRNDVLSLCPFDEEKVFGRRKGPIYLPFGDGESGIHASEIAFALAKAIGVTVVLYHTTWRDERNPSTDARDHMVPAAREDWERLQARATELGVSRQSIIEMAVDVVPGLLESATGRAILIVVARGLKTIEGSYVEQILEQSAVPVLVAGRKETP